MSLHLLDLIENSLRANASVIDVEILACEKSDQVTLSISDNGSGFTAPPEIILNPFYTTKSGKRTGLGLSLFKAAAERADGVLEIGTSALGGALVLARMRLSHPDRSPLGDLAGTFMGLACTHPETDFRLEVRTDRGTMRISTRQVLAQLPPEEQDAFGAALNVQKQIRAGMTDVWPGQLW